MHLQILRLELPRDLVMSANLDVDVLSKSKLSKLFLSLNGVVSYLVKRAIILV